MKYLNELLQKQSVDEFLLTHFTKIPFSMPDSAKNLNHLLNWDVVKTVIENKKSVTRIIRDGVLTKDNAQVDFEEAKKYHNDGHTLLLRYAEASHPKLKELAEDFSKSFRTEVDIQLYCTPENNNAFGWHYDVEEVFIIQTKGSKRYTIRSNTIHPKPLLSSIPKDLQYEKETSNLQMEVLLEAGDWLYIPSGWWHIAKTQKESMHISVGLMPRAAIDVVDYLKDQLIHLPIWRTRLPVHRDLSQEQEIKIYAEAFSKLGEDLQIKFNNPEFISEFIKHTKNK